VVTPAGEPLTATGLIAWGEAKEAVLKGRFSGDDSPQNWLAFAVQWNSYAPKVKQVWNDLTSKGKEIWEDAAESLKWSTEAEVETRSAAGPSPMERVLGAWGGVRFWEQAQGRWCRTYAEGAKIERDGQVVVVWPPDMGRRQPLLVEVGGESAGAPSEYCMVPPGWDDGSGNNAYPMLVVDVDERLPGKLKLRARATVTDGCLAKLSGYLIRGQMDLLEAEVGDVAGEAEGMLYEKRRNPWLAAAAALAMLKLRRTDLLHNWSANLANGFEEMPDGAVVRAWHLLYGGGADLVVGREESAKGWLLKAAARGLPVYMEGLRQLVDGLRLFRGKDAAVDEALAKYEPYLWAADRGEVFTSYRGTAPDAPEASTEGVEKDAWWDAVWATWLPGRMATDDEDEGALRRMVGQATKQRLHGIEQLRGEISPVDQSTANAVADIMRRLRRLSAMQMEVGLPQIDIELMRLRLEMTGLLVSRLMQGRISHSYRTMLRLALELWVVMQLGYEKSEFRRDWYVALLEHLKRLQNIETEEEAVANVEADAASPEPCPVEEEDPFYKGGAMGM
jgi:hypothetical protein